jgi:hypothetical protein
LFPEWAHLMQRGGGSYDDVVGCRVQARLEDLVWREWLMTILDPLTGRWVKIQAPIKPRL